MKIKVTSVYVDDQEKALRFYIDVLGFVKRSDFSQGPFRWLTVGSAEEPNGTELQLALNDNPIARTYQQARFEQGQPAAMFYVDDVQKEYDRMKSLGAEFTMPPTKVTGSTIAMLKDTCGNLIQIVALDRWQGELIMKKSDTSEGRPASELISERIAELGDWRGKTLSRVRKLIKDADADVVEEWKWMGTPVWSHDGIICTGESYKSIVKLTFAKGASLKDPAGLFNSSLDGNVRRAIDIHEGEKIDESALKALVREAAALNSSGKSKSSKKAVR